MAKSPKRNRKALSPEAGRRIHQLRTTLGLNQTEFAERMGGFKKSAVSLWEKGREPSADAYVQLGNLATYPECLWFYEKAGLGKGRFRSLAERVVHSGATPGKAGIVEVRATLKSKEGDKTAPSPITLPAEFAPVAGQLDAYIVTEFSQSSVLAPGDVVIVDSSEAGPQLLTPFWDQVVLVEFLPLPPTEKQAYVEGELPTSGLFLGRLRLKRVFVASQLVEEDGEVFSLTWKATIGPCNDQDKLVLHRLSRSASDERRALWLEDRTGLTVGSFRAALPTEGRAAWGKAEEEAAASAPLRAQLAANVRILGRVVGRYWPSKEK